MRKPACCSQSSKWVHERAEELAFNRFLKKKVINMVVFFCMDVLSSTFVIYQPKIIKKILLFQLGIKKIWERASHTSKVCPHLQKAPSTIWSADLLQICSPAKIDRFHVWYLLGVYWKESAGRVCIKNY